jgi:K+ transporter
LFGIPETKDEEAFGAYSDDGITHVSARFGYTDEPNVPAVLRLAVAAGLECPLEVDDAPYRDVGLPLLGYLRDLTADEQTEVLVLMPELFVRGWRRLLHNQKALYVKRLLLFEPHVILASVPYQLLR